MRPHVLALVVALLGALVVVGPGRVHAARFQVQPTRVDLAGTHHVGSLAVTNRSTEEVRFQITAMAWTESEDGTTGLTPTDELVVYPSLFTLAPGDSRSVRVTSMASPGAREVPYRIFVEELPPLRTSPAPGPTRIRMLTRMAVPVFLPPERERIAGDVRARLLHDGLDLELTNRGTAHVRVQAIRVIGEAHGAVTFDRSTTGWYLLAGGARRYHLPLSRPERAALERVRIEVRTDRATWTTAVLAEPDAR